MGVKNHPTPDFEETVSDNNDADNKDVCTAGNLTATASVTLSGKAEDSSSCSWFLSCLSRCFKSRPKARCQQLPKDSPKRISLTMKWLEDHSNSLEVETPEPDALPQEIDGGRPDKTAVVEITQKPTLGPSNQLLHEKLLKESNPCKEICGLDASAAEVVENLPDNGEVMMHSGSSVNHATSPSIRPDSQLDRELLQRCVNNENTKERLRRSISMDGGIKISSPRSEGRRFDQVTFSKCGAGSSNKDINRRAVAEDSSLQNISKPEDHAKSALEKWRESIERAAPREYFEIDAAVIADGTDAPRRKGLTLHISMDRDKKMYNRPRENVIYQNGLISVHTGDPHSNSEMQTNTQNHSFAPADSDPELSENEC